MRTKYTSLCLLIIALLALTPFRHTPASDKVPTNEELLRALMSHRKSMVTLSIVATWEDIANGVQKGTEEQTWYRDRLGRARLIQSIEEPSRTGRSLEPDGRRRVQRDAVFDGATTITRDEDTDLGLARNAEGFRRAHVEDGRGSGVSGLRSTRDPWTFLDEPLIAALSEATQHLDAVVTIVKQADGTLLVEFTRAPGREIEGLRSFAVVSPERDYAVLKIDTKDRSGVLVRRLIGDYDRGTDHRWLPKSGRFELMNTQEPTRPPRMEWRFRVRSFAINSPDFDESVFVAKVGAGTSVWDQRFDVNYTTGDETVIGDKIARLSERAKRELVASERESPHRASWIGWFIGMNVLFAIVCTSVVVVRRTASR